MSVRFLCVAWLGLLALAAHGHGRDRGVAVVVLCAMSAGEVTAQEAELRLVGACEADVLFDLLVENGVQGPDGRRVLTTEQREVLSGAILRRPPTELRERLDAVAGGSPRSERRVALVMATRRPELALLSPGLLWAGGDEGPFLARELEHLVAALLRTDGRTVDRLRDLLGPRDEPWTAPVLRGVGAWKDERALALLSTRLFDGMPHLSLALEQVGRLACVPTRFDPVLAGEVRRHILSPDVDTSVAAIEAAAALDDHAAVDVLVDQLDARHAYVRGACRRALQSLGGQPFGADPGRWQAWLARERRWWRDRGEDVCREMASPERPVVVSALTEAAGHPLFRRELAPEVAYLLDSPDHDLRRLACCALAQLGAVRWSDALVPLLDDPDDGARLAAHRSLCHLTAADLPSEPEAWREWFEAR